MDTCKDYFVNGIGGDDLDSKWTDLCDELFTVDDEDDDTENDNSSDSSSSKKEDSDSDSDSDDSSNDGDDTEESVFDFYGDFTY